MNYWLVKSEPDAFSIDDLKNSKKKTTSWDGIRNYQARNFMRDDMRTGDQVLFYHSSCKEIGIVGLAEVVKESYPDHTSWDPESKYFDPKSSEDKPRWFMVDIKWQKTFKERLSLEEVKGTPSLAEIRLIQKGGRLSVMPIEKKHFETILKICQ